MLFSLSKDRKEKGRGMKAVCVIVTGTRDEDGHTGVQLQLL